MQRVSVARTQHSVDTRSTGSTWSPQMLSRRQPGIFLHWLGLLSTPGLPFFSPKSETEMQRAGGFQYPKPSYNGHQAVWSLLVPVSSLLQATYPTLSVSGTHAGQEVQPFPLPKINTCKGNSVKEPKMVLGSQKPPVESRPGRKNKALRLPVSEEQTA